MPGLAYLLLLLNFASFSYPFIHFFASNCFQMSLFTNWLEGVLSYNPPVRKSAFKSFDHFLIQPPFVAAHGSTSVQIPWRGLTRCNLGYNNHQNPTKTRCKKQTHSISESSASPRDYDLYKSGEQLPRHRSRVKKLIIGSPTQTSMFLYRCRARKY